MKFLDQIAENMFIVYIYIVYNIYKMSIQILFK